MGGIRSGLVRTGASPVGPGERRLAGPGQGFVGGGRRAGGKSKDDKKGGNVSRNDDEGPTEVLRVWAKWRLKCGLC